MRVLAILAVLSVMLASCRHGAVSHEDMLTLIVNDSTGAPVGVCTVTLLRSGKTIDTFISDMKGKTNVTLRRGEPLEVSVSKSGFMPRAFEARAGQYVVYLESAGKEAVPSTVMLEKLPDEAVPSRK